MKRSIFIIISIVIFLTSTLKAEKGFNLIATIQGESEGDAFSEVCGLGDINQDGYDDFAVGAWESNNGGGYVNIYFGGSELDTVADLKLSGKSYFGWTMDTGDFNGDGVPDLIVGAPYADYFFGEVSLFFGGKDMDNIADITIDGTHTNGFFGHCVANAGDMNGDGYDDFIIGSDTQWEICGYLFIYWGGPEVDDSWDFCMQGLDFEQLGYSCDGIGDLNQDGYDDIIVGTNSDLDPETAYIIYGGKSLNDSSIVTIKGDSIKENSFGRFVAGLGDIDNDSIPDFLVASKALDAHHNGIINIYSANNHGPKYSFKAFDKNGGIEAVSGNIDINNDSWNDLMVGYGVYGSCEGCVLCFLGGSDYDTIPDYTLYGETDYQYFGYSIDEIGNLNDDENKEFIFGQRGTYFYNDSPDELTYGKVIIYSFGEPSSTEEEIITSDFKLRQNYPNPFNVSTTIEFTLAKKLDIKLSIYNIQGNIVKIIEDNSLNQGNYKYTFDATGLTSGIYFYKLNYNNHSIVKKMTYLK